MTQQSLELAKKNLVKQAEKIPKLRHPVRDPTMTTRRFFHDTLVEGGKLSIRQHQNEQTSKILKGKILDYDGTLTPSRKESDHMFHFDYVKEDYLGKVKDFINRYTNDEAKIAEETNSKQRNQFVDSNEIDQKLKTYHCSFIPQVPKPKTARQKHEIAMTSSHGRSKSFQTSFIDQSSHRASSRLSPSPGLITPRKVSPGKEKDGNLS